jgi:hypothetical protein
MSIKINPIQKTGKETPAIAKKEKKRSQKLPRVTAITTPNTIPIRDAKIMAATAK